MKANPSKTTLLPQKSIVINADNSPKRLKQGNKSLFLPKLPGETRNTNPLINVMNGGRVGIKERNSGFQDQIQPFHKPRSVGPHIVPISHRGKFQENPPIPQFNILNRTFDIFPIQLGFGDNKRKRDSFTPNFSQQAHRS